MLSGPSQLDQGTVLASRKSLSYSLLRPGLTPATTRMAYMQMRHTLCRLILYFDMELNPRDDNWSNMPADLFWKMKPLHVKLSLRKD